MDTLQEYLEKAKEFADSNQNLTYALAVLGTFVFAKNVGSKLYSAYKYLLRPGLNLKKTYGEGWAIITGASDGIGKEFAFQLARKGFNIGLVARSKEKLDKVATEIEKETGVKTQTVVFDFNTFYTKEKFKELEDKLQVFDDVSILINNAAVGDWKSWLDETSSNIVSTININVVGTVLITKALLPKLIEGKHRTAVINIGSGVTRYTYTNLGNYTGTKGYINKFTETLRVEFSDKVDVMTATVGPTKTRMNPGIVCFSSNPTRVVRHVLSQIGYEAETAGELSHAMRNYCLNQYFTHYFVRSIDAGRVARRRAKLAKENKQ